MFKLVIKISQYSYYAILTIDIIYIIKHIKKFIKVLKNYLRINKDIFKFLFVWKI